MGKTVNRNTPKLSFHKSTFLIIESKKKKTIEAIGTEQRSWQNARNEIKLCTENAKKALQIFYQTKMMP